MSTVFNISRVGHDANTSDRNNLIVTSLAPELKIIKSTQRSATIPNGSFSVTDKFHHGLGYEPAFISYFSAPDVPGKYVPSRTKMGTLGSFTLYDHFSIVPDKEIFTSTIERGDSGSTGDKTINYVVHIFDQPARMGATGNDKPIGYLDSDHGIIVSQKGFNADTAKIYEQAVNSNTDYLKYHDTFTGSLDYDTTTNGSDSETITHNLGYIPIFFVFGAFNHDPWFAYVPIGRAPQPFASSGQADETNIKIEHIWAGAQDPSTGTFDYRVVIFKNRMVV